MLIIMNQVHLIKTYEDKCRSTLQFTKMDLYQFDLNIFQVEVN